ncbi:hypothetical protein QAD02_021321 [Eretmocerus hayati]|uniref:Uncharacterized protein n=1 Tax=Eretmocerus hayati TaxID=131215 RepID=A0ACC2PRA1_9HYME|nr:hypothetical protein QAD02_021321 [Eretmocerus hayati]
MSSKQKKDYSKYFEFDHHEEGKLGICRICKNKNVKKEVKMKQSNASGLQRHLKISHQKEYEVLFGSKQTPKKASKVTECLRMMNGDTPESSSSTQQQPLDGSETCANVISTLRDLVKSIRNSEPITK